MMGCRPALALLLAIMWVFSLSGAAQGLSEDDIVGVWRGPTVGQLATNESTTDCSGYVTWEFREDGIVVIDFADSFGYSWSAGSWSLRREQGTDRRLLELLVLGLPSVVQRHEGQVLKIVFEILDSSETQITVSVDDYRVDGIAQRLAEGHENSFCDRRAGPPAPTGEHTPWRPEDPV